MNTHEDTREAFKIYLELSKRGCFGEQKRKFKVSEESRIIRSEKLREMSPCLRDYKKQ